MSLLTAASPFLAGLHAEDRRCSAEEYSDLRASEELAAGEGFTTPWWPASGMVLGGRGDGSSCDLQDLAPSYQDAYPLSGCNGRLGFVGYTRDAYGSAIGGVAVKCFLTSTDELVASVTSDPTTGYYIATTPYAAAHYLVVQKPSATPPIAGASLNTITPA